MRKSDKKIDNQIRIVLTDLCENKLKAIEGFQWISHKANYSQFPSTLVISCAFDNEEHFNNTTTNTLKSDIAQWVKHALSKANVHLKDPQKHLRFVKS